MVAEEDRVNIRSKLLDIEQLSAYTVVQMCRSLPIRDKNQVLFN
jgi:hypothetical protein